MKLTSPNEDTDSESDPLHICHVATGFGGGVYTSVRQIVNRQVAKGHRLTVVRDFRGPYPRPGLEDFHSAVQFVEWDVPREISMVRDLAAFMMLFRILRRKRPDVVHLHCAKAGFLGRIVAILLKIPAVYSPRGLPFYRTDVSALRRRFYFMLESILAKFGGVVVACSGRELKGLESLTHRRALITNGIDLAEIDRLAAAAPKKQEATAYTIATVGLINQARNPQLVARLALLSPKSWRWIWIGDGELRHVIAGHPRIEMYGWMPREKAIEALLSAHVLLHPSRWEGLPLVVLEAMALELPVVASNIVGNADVVEHGRTGFLIDKETEYLNTLCSLANDGTLRHDLGANGRKRVEDLFSISALAPKWVALYRAEIERVSG